MKKTPECMCWGIKWAIAVVTILLFFLASHLLFKNSSSILTQIILICSMILIAILTTPLAILLKILPGSNHFQIISCKISSCDVNVTGIILMVLFWFVLGILIGLLVNKIKKRLNQPVYMREFKV